MNSRVRPAERDSARGNAALESKDAEKLHEGEDLMMHEKADEEEADVTNEKPPVKATKMPTTPSRYEVEEHEVSHYPYRAWCRSCVASAGRRDGHPYTQVKRETSTSVW